MRSARHYQAKDSVLSLCMISFMHWTRIVCFNHHHPAYHVVTISIVVAVF